MIDRDQIQEIWAVVSKNTLMTVLTGFGVFWGIFMMVIMLGAGKGLENGVTGEMDSWATNSMFMWTQSTGKPYKGFKQGRSFSLRNSDVKAIRQEISEIDIIAPRNQLGGWQGSNNIVRGERTGAFDLYGDYPEYNKIQKVKLVQGRILNQGDLDEKRKIAVIGKTVYESLFNTGENPIGEYIKVQGVNFKVVGVFRSGGSDANRAEELERSIYVPFTTFQNAFHLGDRVGWLAITSVDEIPVEEAGNKVKDLLRKRHSIHPEDERAFGSWNLQANFDRMTGLFNGIKMLSLIVGIVTLLAGAIGVSNIMLIVVKERTKELGVRRAIGATPWVVIKQILLESVFITGVAGILGVVAGVWIMELVAGALASSGAESGFFSNPEVKLNIVIMALVILMGAGILAGVIPAKRAVDIKPVDALRAE